MLFTILYKCLTFLRYYQKVSTIILLNKFFSFLGITENQRAYFLVINNLFCKPGKDRLDHLIFLYSYDITCYVLKSTNPENGEFTNLVVFRQNLFHRVDSVLILNIFCFVFNQL